MKGLTEITNDLFDIAARLKSVDSNYKLYYNKIAQRYEVHDETQRPQTLAFVVPFAELDARTVQYALYTRVQNAKTVFEEMEKHNARLQREEKRRAVERVCTQLEEVK